VILDALILKARSLLRISPFEDTFIVVNTKGTLHMELFLKVMNSSFGILRLRNSGLDVTSTIPLI
jgi:hypothetical protein